MKRQRFAASQDVGAPLEQVFNFFAHPENLQALTPSALEFQFLTPSPITMRPGALIDHALRIRGIGVHWRSLITCYEPPHKFIDQQLKGPYAFWHHTHTFEALPGGGTRLGDEVLYALPFGPFGTLAHKLFVRSDIEKIFAYRREKIGALFST